MYFYPKGAIEITETEVLEKIYETVEVEGKRPVWEETPAQSLKE